MIDTLVVVVVVVVVCITITLMILCFLIWYMQVTQELATIQKLSMMYMYKSLAVPNVCCACCNSSTMLTFDNSHFNHSSLY